MKTRPSRIQLKGEGIHEEGRAAAVITPGMLIKLNSSGNLIPHDDAGDAFERAFALEDALQGNGIDVNYAIGELVSYAIMAPGDVVFAILGVGEVISIGESLVSSGDGTLQAASSGGEREVGVALENMNLADSGSDVEVNTRIRVRLF